MIINKEKVINELKERLERGEYVDIVSEVRRGAMCHRIKFGKGISISIDEASKVIYVNFAYSKTEKRDILAFVNKIDHEKVIIDEEQKKPKLLDKIFNKLWK